MMNLNLFSTPIILLILLDILTICFFPIQVFSNCESQKFNSSTQQIFSLSIIISGITVYLGGL